MNDVVNESILYLLATENQKHKCNDRGRSSDGIDIAVGRGGLHCMYSKKDETENLLVHFYILLLSFS